MKSQFVIGMDGGGTKTHAVIADIGGIVVAEHAAGPSNFQIIGVEKASSTIYRLITKCCASARCRIQDVHSVALGLTGAGRITDQRRLAQGLKKFALKKKMKLKNLIVESDARAALEGAFKGGPGIILIAGTGSIAFAKDSHGNIHRVGGWGRVLGDEGSGYHIGLHGLTAVTHHLDGRGDETILTKMIAQKFKLTDQAAIIRGIYKNHFDIASVAPLVLDAAARNDVVSRMVVEKAVIELAAHVSVMTRTLESEGTVNVELSLIGGLLANDTLLSQSLKQYIEVNYPQVRIIPPMASPAYGAVVMALHRK